MCSCWGSVSSSSHIETTMVLLRWLWMWPLMLHLFISWIGQPCVSKEWVESVKVWWRHEVEGHVPLTSRWCYGCGLLDPLRLWWIEQIDLTLVLSQPLVLCYAKHFFVCQWSGWRQRGIIYLGCKYVRCRCSTCFLMKSHNKRLREFDLFVEVLGREKLLLGNMNLIPWRVSSTCGGSVRLNFEDKISLRG